MEAKESLQLPKKDSSPTDPTDQQAEGPFEFLADSVAGSVIDHVHPEEDLRRDELIGALKDQFRAMDPKSDYHRRLLLGLRLVGFGLNPSHESDPENENLLILEDEKKFREEFFNNSPDFRFGRGEDLINYLLGFADQEIAKPSSVVRDHFLGEFDEWYTEVEASARVDK